MKFALLSVLAIAASVSAQGPDPSQVYVEGIKYAGSGCPQGTMSQSIAADRQTFTLIFDKHVATIGNGVPITENRKNCQINVGLRFPKGFSFSVFSSQYRGYAQIDKGVHGQHKSTLYFAGQTQQVSRPG